MFLRDIFTQPSAHTFTIVFGSDGSLFELWTGEKKRRKQKEPEDKKEKNNERSF